MSKANKNAKQELIKIYGAKCFIEELGIRKKEEVQNELRLYSKAQRKRMDELTYHHIIKKCNGGKASVENGAILRNINHIWFNRLSKERQAEINQLFKDYKKQKKPVVVGTFLKNGKVEEPVIVDLDLSDCIEIPAYDYTEKDYLEHKKKRNERVFKKFREWEER